MREAWVDVIHKLESGARAPRKMQRFFERVSEQNIIGRMWLQESPLDLDTPSNPSSIVSIKILCVFVEPFDIGNDLTLEKFRRDFTG